MQNLLQTLKCIDALEDLPLIESCELNRYIFTLCDSLSLAQRAAITSICCPYAPDWLQISAVLFPDDEEEMGQA